LAINVVPFRKGDGGVMREKRWTAEASVGQLLNLKEAMLRDNGDSVTLLE
jgi:hypothetical protein